ncbi:hypothetical protein [Nocardia brasiliensis]|uniref:DUF4189 domain-containing protein n=1 Tax=Nocardia brasiliensis (strain ATCC 700358 / HUJEG-1) TaxID=1133849 RepID=K0F6X9_NOCB7|nr:hypothetical protein [Nocardia brasiliensis]AFU05449.1 hypothetical protein O3I_037510 [Nocardia brasiliensis ATCC 700358]
MKKVIVFSTTLLGLALPALTIGAGTASAQVRIEVSCLAYSPDGRYAGTIGGAGTGADDAEAMRNAVHDAENFAVSLGARARNCEIKR